ncbi:vacuolar protein sorting-associated protein Ist1p [Trichomonascus vanleenenianus]|uniref:Ist1p n=1 Tax=Trichomonascus vanleenenianus TaxID=2268995 RepID=UPI003ECB7CE0
MAQVQAWQYKLKAQLKMAINRLRLVQQKETAIAKQQRRNLAQLLEQGKEQSAKIRVENIIREDYNVELLEMLELYCELLLARITLLEQKDCDPGLEEAVKTIIYCASRTEVKELHQVKEILSHKFSKEFVHEALENHNNAVPERVRKRLSSEPPDPKIVTLYLCEIARAYRVPFSELPPEEQEEIRDDEEPGEPPKSPIAVMAPTPNSDNPHPTIKLDDSTPTRPRPMANAKPKTAAEEELDSLKKRFEALRKR